MSVKWLRGPPFWPDPLPVVHLCPVTQLAVFLTRPLNCCSSLSSDSLGCLFLIRPRTCCTSLSSDSVGFVFWSDPLPGIHISVQWLTWLSFWPGPLPVVRLCPVTQLAVCLIRPLTWRTSLSSDSVGCLFDQTPYLAYISVQWVVWLSFWAGPLPVVHLCPVTQLAVCLTRPLTCCTSLSSDSVGCLFDQTPYLLYISVQWLSWMSFWPDPLPAVHLCPVTQLDVFLTRPLTWRTSLSTD